MDEKGTRRALQDKRKTRSVRLITAMQAKHNSRKRCMLVAIQFFHTEEASGRSNDKEAELLQKYPVLQQYAIFFPVEVPRLPPHREIYFSIKLVLGEAPSSKAPYRTSMPELVELKLNLKEMLNKSYIRPSMSPCGGPILFVRNMEPLDCALISGT